MESEELMKKTPTSNKSPYFGHTPKRTTVQKSTGTPLKAIQETVESDENKITPCVNPFDVKAESFYLPSCSPSIFATFSRSNKENNDKFRWSIEHLSVLYPTDIDETSIPEPWTDPDQEIKVQQAIDTFFSQNSIVPSPWSQSSSTGGGKIKIRRTLRRSGGQVQNSTVSNDAATQTKLTIPPSVDLMALLGEYFSYDEDDSYCSASDSAVKESDLLSSSLRRKLFNADEEICSPSWHKSKTAVLEKHLCTPNLKIQSAHSTPSDLLSSSPISPPNCSDCCNIFPMNSPAFSPIAAPKSRTSIRMQSFSERIDEESNSSSGKESYHSFSPAESMSFCTESQDAIAFPSYNSEKQDTGYGTGSLSSLPSATTSSVNYGAISRITPVAELMEDCGISNSDLSVDNAVLPKPEMKNNLTCNINTWPWMPTCCSTPSEVYNLEKLS